MNQAPLSEVPESSVRESYTAVRVTPRKERDLYGWACETIFHPTWERFVKGRNTPAYLAKLERTQWWAAEEIERLQLAKLRALLAYAQASVPYYRDLFAQIGLDAHDITRREHMRSVPVLTKDIIRERYDDLVDPLHRESNFKKGTSGSTGTPLKFEHSRESYDWREATKIRGYRWGGYRLGSPTFHYWAQVQAPKGSKALKIKLDRGLKREVVVDSMRNDERSMLAAIDLFRRTKPTSMVAYTQSCAIWARFILERGLRDWEDVPVLCGAEAVLDQDRAVLSRAFGPVFETYGSRETMLMASECEAHDGMHMAEENIFLEVDSPEGAGSGPVVVTDLHNYGMPFIRYVNGDLATMHDEAPCPCGRGLRKLRHIDGRRADTLVDKDGKEIPGIVFHVLFSDARKEIVSQFQAVQHKDRSVTLKVVRGQDWDEQGLAAIATRLGGYLRGLPLTVEETDRIEAAKNGKRKTIIVER